MPLPFNFVFEPPTRADLRVAIRDLHLWAMIVVLCLLAGGTIALMRARRASPDVSPDATLVIASNPDGATMLIDGRERGRTPATLALTPGHHRVTLRLARHADITYDVELALERQAALDGLLWPQTPVVGRLRSPLPGAVIADARFLPDGRLALVLALPGRDERQLWLVERGGDARLAGPPGARLALAIVRDGSRVAYLGRDGTPTGGRAWCPTSHGSPEGGESRRECGFEARPRRSADPRLCRGSRGVYGVWHPTPRADGLFGQHTPVTTCAGTDEGFAHDSQDEREPHTNARRPGYNPRRHRRRHARSSGGTAVGGLRRGTVGVMRSTSAMGSPDDRPRSLRTPAGEVPLHESRLRAAGREWAILHTGAVLTHADEARVIGEPRDRLPYGVALWPAAIALAHEVAARADGFRGRRVLELGAGTGLPGLVAAALGGRVVQTDRDEVALAVCRRNGERNRIRTIGYRLADWAAWADAGRYHWILGADILYAEAAHPHLRRIFESNLAPGGRVLLADPFRGAGLRLLEALEADGWAVSLSQWRVGEEAAMRPVGLFELAPR